MGRNKSSTEDERRIIWRLFREGKNISEIARSLECSRKKIQNAIKHFQKNETFANLQRKRSRKTTKREDSLIVRQALLDPFATSTQIRAVMERDYGVNLASRTIRQRLLEKNLRGCQSLKKPKVSHGNRQKRIAFVRSHIDSPLSFWNNVIWSDESKFNLCGPDGRTYVRRPPNKELDPKYCRKTVKFGGGSVMVWGCFTKHGVGPIVRIKDKLDGLAYRNLLSDHLVPYLENLPLSVYSKAIFQQDNAPCHKARIVNQWIEDQAIIVLDWPAQSPDLNPIENLWAVIKRKVMALKPTNLEQLWLLVEQEWTKIPKDVCENLVSSMPRRCAAVVSQKGYPTKY